MTDKDNLVTEYLTRLDGFPRVMPPLRSGDRSFLNGLPVWVCLGEKHDEPKVFFAEQRPASKAGPELCSCGKNVYEDEVLPMYLSTDDNA